MTVSPLYLVRRCDGFYRYWHDVTQPASLRETYAAYEGLTGGGAHSTTPDDREYYDLFEAELFPALPDSPSPLIRRLHRQDAAAIEAHLFGLSADDRRFRFFRPATDAQLRVYVDGIAWSRSVLVGAILGDKLIGLAEAVFDRDAPPRRAEIAVSVESAYRGRGLGRHLVSRVVERAELLGAHHPHVVFLQENRPLRRIVRALGGQIELGPDELVGILGAAPALGGECVAI